MAKTFWLTAHDHMQPQRTPPVDTTNNQPHIWA